MCLFFKITLYPCLIPGWHVTSFPAACLSDSLSSNRSDTIQRSSLPSSSGLIPLACPSAVPAAPLVKTCTHTHTNIDMYPNTHTHTCRMRGPQLPVVAHAVWHRFSGIWSDFWCCLAGQGAWGAVRVCAGGRRAGAPPQVVALSVQRADLGTPPNESVKLKMKGMTAVLFV